MIILCVIIVLLIAILIGLYAAYYRVFYSPKKEDSETETPENISRHPFREVARTLTKKLTETPCQRVGTKSYDGLRLSARYYKGREDMPLCICFHGYHGSALRDFSGIGLFLIHEGYNVLLVDERAHWRSQGHTITFGLRERYDVVSWVQFANRRYGADTPILLFGISLGGGTVLMASGQELPDNVKGIVADCPFSSPKDVIKHVCRKVHLNPALMWPIIWLSGLIYGHINTNETTAAIEAKKTKTPILIMHGEGDTFVPMSMSKVVKDANPDMVEMHTFPEAGHGLSYFYYSEQYETIVRDFIQKHIAE